MRNYKKKISPKVKRVKATQAKLDTALHLLKNNNSIRGTAKQVGLPVSTLRSILKKQNSQIDLVNQIKINNYGKPNVLPQEDEETLARAISLRAKWGFGLTRSDIQDLVRDYIDLYKDSDTKLGEHLRKYCPFKVSKLIACEFNIANIPN